MARIVAVILVAIPIAALWLITHVLLNAPPSATAQDLAGLNPQSLLGSSNDGFTLPTPVAVIPAQPNAGPPAQSAGESANSDSGSAQQVKVANTGGIGAVLRASPPRGPSVGALRDGQTLDVLGRQDVAGDTWVHVRTADGKEGWVYGRLVVPAS